MTISEAIPIRTEKVNFLAQMGSDMIPWGQQVTVKWN